MAEFDSPIVGALSLDCLSYGLLMAVNSIWSWVTFIAAVVGFWRVRALQSRSDKCGDRWEYTRPASTIVKASAAAEPDVTSSKKLQCSSSTAPILKTMTSDGEGSPKVKFSVYYGGDALGEIKESGDDDECGGGGGIGSAVAWQFGNNGCDEEGAHGVVHVSGSDSVERKRGAVMGGTKTAEVQWDCRCGGVAGGEQQRLIGADSRIWRALCAVVGGLK